MFQFIKLLCLFLFTPKKQKQKQNPPNKNLIKSLRKEKIFKKEEKEKTTQESFLCDEMQDRRQK